MINLEWRVKQRERVMQLRQVKLRDSNGVEVKQYLPHLWRFYPQMFRRSV